MKIVRSLTHLHSLPLHRLLTPRPANGRHYPRDIGVSTHIPSHRLAIYQFGDTFVYDAARNFVDLPCSTASVVTDISRPTISTYAGVHCRGKVPVNPPVDDDEDQPPKGYRTTTWCFGASVFPPSNSQVRADSHIVEGFTYYQNSHLVGSHSYDGTSEG